MSARRLVPVSILVIAILAAVPIAAGAWRGDSSETLLIGFELHFTGETSTAGTFVASGALDDSGTSTVENLALVPFGRRDRARLSGTQTFVGADGTVVTRFEGIASDVSQPHQFGQGRFRVVSGTGEYEGIDAHGRFTIVVDAAGNKLIGTEVGRVR